MTRFPRSAALALCLFAAGCGQREAVEFNNALVNSNAKLSAARKALQDAVANTDTGKGDAETVRQRYSANVATLAEVKKEIAALAAPPSETGKKLAAKYQDFLAWQSEALDKQLAEVVKLLEDPKQEPLSRRARVRALMKEVEKRDVAALGELRDLQMTFAKEHDITLKKPER